MSKRRYSVVLRSNSAIWVVEDLLQRLLGDNEDVEYISVKEEKKNE